MARVYAPTPHRIALCSLARYLNDDDDEEAEGATRRSTTRLGPRDRRRLARLLMELTSETHPTANATTAGRSEAESGGGGFREPALGAFKATLDARSRADGAPPARPEVTVPSFTDATDAHDDAEKPPVNFKDLLGEALGRIRNVDDLLALFAEVAPRSAHVAALRGSADDGMDVYGWSSPGAVEPNSIVGLFLRRCCLDFERLTFEARAITRVSCRRLRVASRRSTSVVPEATRSAL